MKQNFKQANITFRIIVGVCFTILIVLFIREEMKVKTCKDFSTWLDAQDAFTKDPSTYGFLDGDKDGIACDNRIDYLLTKKY